MKVALISTFFSPVVGGMESIVADLAIELKKQGLEVEVLTTNSNRNSQVLNSAAHLEDWNGITVKRAPVMFHLTEFHKFSPALYSLIARSDADVFHVHGLRKLEGYWAQLIAKLNGKKIILSTHNPFTVNERSTSQKLFIFLSDLLLGKLWLRFVDKFIVLSETEISKLQKLYGIKLENMVQINNAINDVFFAESKADRTKVLNELGIVLTKSTSKMVLSIGRLHKVKGFQNLLQAAMQNPEVNFVVVGGDGGYLEELKKLSSEIANFYIVDRFFSQTELAKLMSSADLFVFPSLHEPFGLLLVEAMASKLPVIATASGGPEEILDNGKYGVLVPADNTSALADAIKNVLASNEASTYKELAKVRAKDFSWQNVIAQYLAVYQETK